MKISKQIAILELLKKTNGWKYMNAKRVSIYKDLINNIDTLTV